MEENSQEKET